LGGGGGVWCVGLKWVARMTRASAANFDEAVLGPKRSKGRSAETPKRVEAR